MQLALPFPKFANLSRTLNNGVMTRKNDELPAGETTRTSDRRRRGAASRVPSAPPITPRESAQKLRSKALRMLTTREHSREELMRKLAQAKVRNARRNADSLDRDSDRAAKDDIELLVDQLAAQGWQSDERYADALVRRLSGQASRRYIADKLAQVGIKKEAAEIALETLEQDDRDIARALWERRFGAAPTTDKERQRQIRFLLSRGFHLSDAFKIVPKLSPMSDSHS